MADIARFYPNGDVAVKCATCTGVVRIEAAIAERLRATSRCICRDCAKRMPARIESWARPRRGSDHEGD